MAGQYGVPMNGHHTPEACSPRMLVLIARHQAALRAGPASIESATGTDVSDLNRILAGSNIHVRCLFGESEERAHAKTAAMGAVMPSAVSRAAQGAAPGAASAPATELDLYYWVEAPDEQLDELAGRLAAEPAIAGAYITPQAQPAMVPPESVAPLIRSEPINAMAPVESEAPSTTDDWTGRQGYLAPAPGGIDARFAWTFPGGSGADVQIIDCEGAWRFTHEDLRANQGGVIRMQTNDLVWRNHGTAVVGVLGGDRNTFGVTGICPDANTRGSSIFDTGGLPGAIVAAADRLRPGDIILLEVQYSHPDLGYTAVEWWPADYAAIRYAVNRGIIVVEAAGNGNNDFDHPIYDTPLGGFPPDWRNPFDRAQRDSGAILVGAGAPPPGTHGSDHGPDRSRLSFSNFGSAIDAQGWGREVTTAGYGDLQGGPDEDLWYTDRFSGTSSASPTVVGALTCVQGILRAEGRVPLDPAEARGLLRNSGSPQQDAPGRPIAHRIGNRPNLRQLIPLALGLREGTAMTANDIQQPQDFDLVGNPILISGIGTGFEAVLQYRIHDGHEERTGFFHVGGGTGEHGQFQVSVDVSDLNFQLDRLFVEVFEESARDGSEINKVIRPVIYGPRIVPGYIGYRLYEVKSGDTLSAIAREHYGVSSRYYDIVRANPTMIPDPDRIFLGQVLKIPIGA